jgi:hypothetical protein
MATILRGGSPPGRTLGSQQRPYEPVGSEALPDRSESGLKSRASPQRARRVVLTREICGLVARLEQFRFFRSGLHQNPDADLIAGSD